jgi:thioredoxin reductase
MSRSHVEVIIIGAGPYGLSIASHLTCAGVTRRIFGFPMRAWRLMPPGLFLKSFGFATNIPTPHRHYTLPEYCRSRGLEDFEPILTSTFAEYGDWFQRELVPDVEQVQVTDVARVGDGFDVMLETGERVRARRVVMAVGLGHFPNIPQVFASLPENMVTHASRTAEYLKAGGYAGQDVTVVGAGQSALEAAALLHEGGARVQLVARHDVWWSTKMGKRSMLEKLRNPNTVIGPGRKNWVIEHFPMLPFYVPTDRLVPFTRRYLGPLGAWWLRDRVEGKVPMMKNTSILSATTKNGRAVLQLRHANGEQRVIETDHVISGTGYEANIDRLTFLDRTLASQIRRVQRAPALSRHFESSVPGLYFVGPIASFSFGPLVRFVAGAEFSAPRVTRHLQASLKGSVAASL